MDPNNATAYFQRGWTYGVKRDPDRAIADFDKAIQIDPTNAVAYDDRGAAYGVKTNYDKALADFSESIRLDPKRAKFLTSIGRGFTATGRTSKRPAPILQKWPGALSRKMPASPPVSAATQHPKTSSAEILPGMASLSPGDNPPSGPRNPALVKLEQERSIEWWTATITADPSNALAYYSREMLRRKGGETPEAVADFTDAIRLGGGTAKRLCNGPAPMSPKEWTSWRSPTLPQPLPRSSLPALLRTRPRSARGKVTKTRHGFQRRDSTQPQICCGLFAQGLRLQTGPEI